MVFDPAVYTEFRYCGAKIDPETFRIDFDYELAGEGVSESFRETISLTPVKSSEDVDWPRVKALVVLLGAVVGLSYYKAAAPARYVIAVDGMTEKAVDYLREVITHGLAEFAYRNGFPGPIAPEIVVTGERGEAWPPESHLTPSGDPLVPIGGGKDSVVTVELLAQARMHPVQFGVNPNQVMYRVARIKGNPFIQAKRTLDPRLLELNAIGALNGHIPVTAINSLIAIVQARLVGFGPVVMSLEASASEPTLWWGTMPVNHQWYKSQDAEALLQDVLGHQEGLSAGSYYSLHKNYIEIPGVEKPADMIIRSIGKKLIHKADNLKNRKENEPFLTEYPSGVTLNYSNSNLVEIVAHSRVSPHNRIEWNMQVRRVIKENDRRLVVAVHNTFVHPDRTPRVLQEIVSVASDFSKPLYPPAHKKLMIGFRDREPVEFVKNHSRCP
jgi:hypothetical protein